MKYIIMALLIAACGGDPEAPEPKDLFSYWQDENTSFGIDMAGSAFGNNLIEFWFPEANKCICNLNIIGDQDSGSYILTECIYIPPSIGGTGNGTDPGCEAIDGTGSYSKTSDVLTLCVHSVGSDPSTCVQYR